jgi:hypothetical protein
MPMIYLYVPESKNIQHDAEPDEASI